MLMDTRIRDLRQDNDITQSQISKMLNISQVAYSYYELNKRSIPLDLLIKLADFYNTSVDYILCRTEDPRPYKSMKRAKEQTLNRRITSNNKKRIV